MDDEEKTGEIAETAENHFFALDADAVDRSGPKVR